MTIKEAYDKYKHLDKLLSDTRLTGDGNPIGTVAHDLWIAIKKELDNVLPHK